MNGSRRSSPVASWPDVVSHSNMPAAPVQTLFHHRQHDQRQSRPPRVPDAPRDVKLRLAEADYFARRDERQTHLTSPQVPTSRSNHQDRRPTCPKPQDAAGDRRTHGHVISAQTPASRARTTSKYHGHSPSRSSREPPAGLPDR